VSWDRGLCRREKTTERWRGGEDNEASRTPMSLQLTPVPYQGGGSGAATPTLTGLRRRSVWDRFTREGALESASVSRSEAAELNNRAK